MFLLLLTTTGVTIPAQGVGKHNRKSKRSARQQLAENLKIIHHNSIESAITDSLIKWRKNRADSLRDLIDSTQAQ